MRVPVAGNDVPMPSIDTFAAGSEECQESVIDSPPHTAFCDAVSVSVGRAHAETPPGARTARRRDGAGGGGFGWNDGV